MGDTSGRLIDDDDMVGKGTNREARIFKVVFKKNPVPSDTKSILQFQTPVSPIS